MFHSRSRHRLFFSLIASFIIVLGSHPLRAATIEDNLKTTAKTNKAGAASQQKIEKLSRETEELLAKYKKLLHSAEYQEAYSAELQELKEEQEKQIDQLEEQINNIKVTQQRIMPLMHGMAETLEQFILLDLPFQQEQRLSKVLVLKQQLKSATLTAPAKFRSVWEAYQVETDYGRTIETWRGPVKIDGEEFSVEFLRIGRIALFYQTLDKSHSAYWNHQQRQWQTLDDTYADNIKHGIRVASSQLAPQLLHLPLGNTATEVK